MFIYMLRNKTNGKCYVGLTSKPDVNIRLGQHKNSANYENHSNSKTAITRAIKKHGWDSFDLFVLQQCEFKDELIEAERHWISFYNCMTPHGYNNTRGGEYCELSDEAKRERSERMLGHNVSEETKRRISEAHRGKTLTEEHRAKISAGLRRAGRKLSEEQKLKLIASNSGELNSFSKLTWEQVRTIRSKYLSGEITQYQLAEEFNVSVPTISRIVKNKIWKEQFVSMG